MDTLTIPPPNAVGQKVLRCRPPAIYVDGQRHRELQLMKWEILPAPVFGKALLALTGSRASGSCGRLGDAGKLPAIGSNIRIRTVPEASVDEFIGSVVTHSFTIEEDGEHSIVQCEHQLAIDLEKRINNLWRFVGESAIEVKEARITFGTNRNASASDTIVTVNGRQCRVFDSGPETKAWSVADALGYLLAAAVQSNVEVPSLSQLDDLAGKIDLGPMDVTGKTAAEALVEVARKGGLELCPGQRGLGLVFYRPGKLGRRRHVHLQPAGSDLSPSESNLWRGRIDIRSRPSQCSVLVLGQLKQYESTFELAKGWDESLETGRWRDFVRSKANNWPKVADVYRKWVLNEHGWYSGNPWNLSVHSFANISTDDFTVQVARKLLPCLSTDLQGQSLGVVVEIRCEQEGPWRRWRGPVWVSQDECAVYLGGDALPGEFFQAAANNEAGVRVSAVVAADARLTANFEGNPRLTRKVFDLSGRVAWKHVHSSSIFKGYDGVGPSAERDDSELINSLAAQHAETAATSTEAEFTLGWIDTSFHVGDIVERVDGRAFGLASDSCVGPRIRSVRHDFGTIQTTRLLVSG